MRQLHIYCRLEKPHFIIKILLGIYLIFSLNACESFLKVDPPQSQIVGELVFQEKNLANAALADIYFDFLDRITSASYFTTYIGLYTGELYYTGSQFSMYEDYINCNVLPSNSTNKGFWSKDYTAIYKANAIIEGMDNSTTIGTADKNWIKGEALFFRAYLHFYLVNLFGDIPYISTTDYTENSKVSRMPVQEVYAHLVADLIAAKELLPENYTSTVERVHINKWVASALLSRVYLYSGQWEKAQSESTSLITNSLFTMETDLSKVFLKESTSIIFSLKSQSSMNASDGTFYIQNSSYISSHAFLLSEYMANAFEPSDQRRSLWIGSLTTTEGNTIYFSSKYKEIPNSTPSKEFSVLLRIEEQYLIRAEARAHLGDITGARQDLNTIRNRAGLGNTNAATLNNLLEAILHERQVEFFLEVAHPFFDMKRMGFADTVLGSIKPGWDATDVLFPIPESEILLNSNLTQNPGY
ncbi:MAG: hypothetical protein A2X18_13110 [Bacteroidetes bacterium GWF2_40_14]|nr:MAG: hypothetical protein A2X18_13110 [Bacteroidetes bacterium GWF2_40_14]